MIKPPTARGARACHQHRSHRRFESLTLAKISTSPGRGSARTAPTPRSAIKCGKLPTSLQTSGPTNHKSLRYDLDLAKTDVKYGNPGTARQWVLVVPAVNRGQSRNVLKFGRHFIHCIRRLLPKIQPALSPFWMGFAGANFEPHRQNWQNCTKRDRQGGRLANLVSPP